MRYADLLAVVYKRLARHWDIPATDADATAFGQSIRMWPAFADTVSALHYLAQHYTLVILSNVDRTSFAASNRILEVAFDAIYTAEDIGSYKPDPRNFAYMLDQLAARGVDKTDILHTAQSLFHDHVPATAADTSGDPSCLHSRSKTKRVFKLSRQSTLTSEYRAPGR